ncbi:MAG: YicC/YloC family endoribonuclease [Bacteroidota bacterium]|nr:YicC/YloC family endoribonuclease [Bacteroidota bacterium]MDP4236616.1 YicC/YloC family endoribonuclease [Bacteroidota bacterium]
MTGFGRGEATSTTDRGGLTATAEVRSVNSRFLETSVRLPRNMSEREFEVRELVRKSLERGKININITITRGEAAASVPLEVNESLARGYFDLLDRLRTVTGMTAEITLRDLTGFSDIFLSDSANADAAAAEWKLAQEAVTKSLEALHAMRKQEGSELEKDLRMRIANLDDKVNMVEKLSSGTSEAEFAKLKLRVLELTQDVAIANQDRLDMEIALIAERLDITEEIVRFRSHIKFFLEALAAPEPAGRKLNFLIQEMNREINTMGSKTNDPQVSHLVVTAKEEMEKIREQIQNVE